MFFVVRCTLPVFVILSILSHSNALRDIDSCTIDSKQNIKYLTNLIAKAQKDAVSYQLPKGARQYAADSETVTDFGTFDFIVVGAGSGGTVVANRLSEISHFTVLLLEAGDYGDCLTNIPNMYYPVQLSKYNWGYLTTPQTKSCQGMIDKMCPVPRGRGIGGTTLINGLVYSRGSRIDYDRWAKHVNDSRWSYKEVLPYFKKSENFVHRDKSAPVFEPVHGKGGYLNVEYHLPISPHVTAFLEANEELGIPIADYNAGTGLGASPVQANTKNGTRMDGGKAFILPILNRKNLVVLANSYVTKILTYKRSKTAYGVAFNHGNKKYTATVTKEVIISAGAINTPQLLMLSGIGPKRHLEALNIPVFQDLEVGSGLKNHPSFNGLIFETNYTEPIKPLEDYVKQFVKGYGPLTPPGDNEACGFYESQYTNGTGYPDFEILFLPANCSSDLSQKGLHLTDSTYEDLWKHVDRSSCFNMFVAALHPASSGTVRLKSSDPLEYPLIDYNFLTDPQDKDIETLYEGVQLALKLAATRAFRKMHTHLYSKPLSACSQHKYLSKKYWYCAIRQVSKDFSHPVGTCPMGLFPEKGAVVNAKLQVYGVRRLRIVDASVIPIPIAGHTNAPIVMIAEVVSDIIKHKYLH